MKKELSIGKYRGLQQISNDRSVFTVVALDHRGSLKKVINPANPEAVSYADVVALKLDITAALAPQASAMLMDVTYTAHEAIASGSLPGRTGLLITLEESGYVGPSTARQARLVPGWDVGTVRRMGASAVKLLLYYHPHAASAELQEEFLRQVAADCRAHDIPLVLECLSYAIDPAVPTNSAAFAAAKPWIVAETARRLCPLGADAFKAEFPADMAYEQDEARLLAACQAVTEAAGVPWMVLSAGVDHPTFCRQVELACRGGASGFLAGRSIWKEAVGLAGQARRDFLADEATQRLAELTAIANAHARPWTDWYECRAGEGWAARYGSGV